MGLTQYAYLITCVLAISTGQLLFKLAARQMNAASDMPMLLALFTNYFLWGALAVQFVSAMSWTWLLRTVPLGYAYPFIALTFVLVPLLGSVVLHEEIERTYLLGSALIVAGIIVTKL